MRSFIDYIVICIVLALAAEAAVHKQNSLAAKLAEGARAWFIESVSQR